MEDKIEHAPLLANPREDPLELIGLAYIAGDDYRTRQFFADRAHVWLRLGIEVSNRQLRAGLMESFRAAVGDAVHVRDTHDQSAFLYKRHYFLFSMAWPISLLLLAPSHARRVATLVALRSSVARGLSCPDGDTQTLHSPILDEDPHNAVAHTWQIQTQGIFVTKIPSPTTSAATTCVVRIAKGRIRAGNG